VADPDVKDDSPKTLGRILLRRRPAAAIARPRDPAARHAQLMALSEMYGVPALDLDQICLKTEDLANVPRSLARHHLLIPVLARADRLFVAMKDPSQSEVIQEVEFVAGKRVYAYAAPPEDIAETIERAYSARERGAVHYVGPQCPEETLRKAGLLPDASPAPALELMPPSSEVLATEEAVPPRSLAIPAEPVTLRDSGPPATVSAHPPRLSSLPPALRGRASELGDDGDVVSAVEQAFEDLLDDVSSVASGLTEPLLAADREPPLVMIVDDEADSRALLEQVLGGHGYRVKTAQTGRQALRMIKEQLPDLLVLSALLPEVHGFEIARRLRGSQRYGGLRIVMLSAVHRGWRLAEELRGSCGVEHYLEKPLRSEDILRAVNAALCEESPAGPIQQGAGGADAALDDAMVAYKAGEVDAAIAHLERAMAIDPLAYRVHFHLGLLFAERGQTYDAIRALERAVEINSRHFAGLKNLAIMYTQAGFRNKAAEMWTRGRELAPDDETRAAIDEHLAALLSQEGLS
jgi:CheY-like chemotaxis protein